MKTIRSFTLLLLVLFSYSLTPAIGQVYKPTGSRIFLKVKYTGVVQDSVTNQPLMGAVISHIRNKDGNVVISNSVTNREGRFEYTVETSLQRRIEVSYLGYKLHTQSVPQDEREVDLGVIKMVVDPQKIDDIVVKARMEMYRMSGDTTLFFPRTVKTLKGDPVIEILRRMPGVRVTENNDVYIDGKKVERSYINGRLIFGDDPTKPLITLDAKDAALIQAYDEQTEMGKVMDDKEQKRKVLNVITFEDFKDVFSANVTLEGGADSQKDANDRHKLRYAAEGSAGFYSEMLQVSIDGDMSNVNDIRAGTLDDNYYRRANAWVDIGFKIDSISKLKLDYQYGGTKSQSESSSVNTYFPTNEFNAQSSFSENNSTYYFTDHNVSTGYDLSKNKTLFITNVGMNRTKSNSTYASQGETTRDGESISQTESTSKSGDFSQRASINISLVQRIKNGTLLFSTGLGFYKIEGSSMSEDYVSSKDYVRNRQLSSDDNNSSISNRSRLSYQFRLGNGSLSVESDVDYSYSADDKMVTNLGSGMLENMLSRDNTSNSTKWNNKVRYQMRVGKANIGIGLVHNSGFIRYNETIPAQQKINRNYYAFLPQLNFTSGFGSKRGTFSVYISGMHHLPSASSLSAILRDSNPLFVSTGNPSLKDGKSYTLRLSHRIRFKNSSSLSYSLGSTYNIDPQINNRIYFDETTVLPQFGDYQFIAGSTLSMPVNGKNNFRISPRVEYDMNIPVINTLFNISMDYDYSNPEDGVNNLLLRTRKHTGHASASLESNFSERFRVKLHSDNELSSFRNSKGFVNRLYSGDCGIDMKWYMWERVFLEGTYVYNYYRGTEFPEGVNNHLLNLSVGCHLFRDQKGKIMLNGYNILDRVTNVTTGTTDQYSYRTYRDIATQYFSISFVYKFSNSN